MNKKTISFVLNGKRKEFDIDPNERLLDLLRRHGYLGAKHGCREGTCGACTVMMDGKAVASCVLYAFQADGREIVTIEGLDDCGKSHEIQEALIEEGAVQCGYCTPGIIVSAQAMFDENPVPDEATIKVQMDGNLCRCTGYEKIWSALKKVAEGHAKRGEKK